MDSDQLTRITTAKGFIAALDQSGGSTPKALALYGVAESDYADEAEMFDLVHEMRTRIITSPAFTGERVLAAILFEQTMDREVGGVGTAEYLWREKGVVPFLKVDRGLADEAGGVRLMKPMPDLASLLERAVGHGVFGTKMRSFITLAEDDGVDAVVRQQFDVARQILSAGLVPIVEPEVDIHSPQKGAAEGLLRSALLRELDALDADQRVMLKLTLPDADDHYAQLVGAPERPTGRRALGRVHARRGRRAPRPQPRRHRELLPGTHRRAARAADPGRVRRRTGRGDREHLRGIRDLRPELQRS